MPESPFRRVRALLARPGVLWRLRRLRALEVWTGTRIAYGNRVEVFHRGRDAFDAPVSVVRDGDRSRVAA